MIRTYWWSPAQSARTFINEYRRHPGAWLRVARGRRRASINFGDEFTPLAVKELLGTTAVWSPLKDADLVMVGSVLNEYIEQGSSARVFGAGLRQGSAGTGIPTERVIGVRGRGTLASLGLDQASVSLGDPGLLVRSMVEQGGIRRGVCLVPHFNAFASAKARSLIRGAAAAGATIVSPAQPPLEVARAINGCDLVLSSSLHGLVFADAVGVPRARVTIAGHTDPSFKYDDYESAFDATTSSQDLELLVNSWNERAMMHAAMEHASRVSSRVDGLVGAMYASAGRW
jgi:Polysaccharide pyruvyl transferase